MVKHIGVDMPLNDNQLLMLGAVLMAVSILMCWVAYQRMWRWRWWVYLAAYLPGYLGLQQLSVASFFQPIGEDAETVGVLWLSGGLLMGSLINAPWRLWPVYFAMTAAALTFSDLVLYGHEFPPDAPYPPWVISAGWTLAALLEGALGAASIRLILGRVPDLIRPRDLILFLLLCVLLATAVSAALGTLIYARVFVQTEFIKAWQVWWFSNALGTLAFAPVLVSWYHLIHEPLRPMSWRRRVEAAGLFTALVFVSLVCLGPLTLGGVAVLDFPYLVVPVLVWAALRFNAMTSGIATILTATIAVLTAKGSIAGWFGLAPEARGPFYVPGGTPADTVLPLQAFLLIMLGSMPVIVSLYRQRQRSEHEAVDVRGQLYEAQRLESVAQLAGGVAHDLNNLLAVISAYRAQVDERVGDDPGLQDALLAMDQATDHAASLSRSLLDLSRHDAVATGPIELAEALRHALKLYKPLIPRQVHIHTDTSTGQGLVVQGDSGQLQQVIINLLVNARDAMMPGGGRIEAWVRRSETMPDCAELGIRDQGKGIEPNQREHIFEPLFTTKPRGQGTGLGLSIVRSIVEEHGGTIRVESEPGAGTTFLIYLPLIDHARAQPPEAMFRTGVFVPERDLAPAAATEAVVHNRPEIRLLISDPQVRGAISADLAKRGWPIRACDQADPLQTHQDDASSRPAITVLDRQAFDDLDRDASAGLPVPMVLLAARAPDQTIDRPGVTTILMPFKIETLARQLEALRQTP